MQNTQKIPTHITFTIPIYALNYNIKQIKKKKKQQQQLRNFSTKIKKDRKTLKFLTQI